MKLTPNNGKRTAIILPLAEYRELLEDVEDLSVIASRKDEPTVSLAQVKRRLNNDSIKGS